MKETKVYVVKKPSGEDESYQEPIVKVFLDKKKAKEYVKEENAKLPLEQAKKCDECYFMWECAGQKGKERPSCFKGDKYNNCENYFKYHDIQELFIEEHSIDDIKTHDKEILEEQREKTFILYSLLYQELEKQDIENVASRIDFMTSENYADICELYKTAKNLKQHDRELVKEVCEKISRFIDKMKGVKFDERRMFVELENLKIEIQKDFEK